MAAEALARLGRLDILVNNAGAIKGGDFLTTPDEEWLNGWSLKLLGYIRMAREVLPHMQRQGGGRIVNVVGAAARNPAPTYMMGGTANAALINFTKALADLGAPSRVLVTAVSPGPVKTERWDTLMAQQARAANQDVADYVRERGQELPLGRIALPGRSRGRGVLSRVRAGGISYRHHDHRRRRHHPRRVSVGNPTSAIAHPVRT